MLGSIACLGDCIGSAEVAGSEARSGWAQAPAWVWGQARAVKMTVGTVASRRQASSLGKVVLVESIAGEGDGGVVCMVGGEMNRGESRSSSLYLSSSNLQWRFRVFFAGGGAVGESA
jgi:hypothetical protein